MSSLKELLERDEHFIAFKRIVQNSKSGDYEKLIKELQNMHKGRLSRSISRRTTKGGLVDAAGQDQSYRSRATEIMMNLVKVNALLESTHTLTRAHILTRYRKSLAKYKTKGEREQAVNTLLYAAKDILHQIKIVDKMAVLLVEDIDRAIWPIRYALERHSMAQKPEHSL